MEKKKKENKTEKKVTDETIMYKPDTKATKTKKQNEQRITRGTTQGYNTKSTAQKTDTSSDTKPLSKPKQKKDKKHKKHPKLRMFLKIVLILFILGTVTVARNIRRNCI